MSAEPSHAVFLSYAREDTDAARRIADALRGFGVEVWFDQSELRGGDAWDQKIRTQIRTCALFLPLISGTTQSRGEGYFRREWKLAVERTADMAASRAFLVPIAIDATSESQAEVPEEFARVQWTRLPGGMPTPQFVEQIKRLLETPRKASAATRPAFPMAAPAPEPATTAAASHAPGFSRWVVAVVGVALLGAVAYFALRPATREPATGPKPTIPSPIANSSAPAAPAVAAKSIAVLAFANFGGDKENEYFSDGITEELLNVLAKVPGLRVAARTSAFYFKDKNVPIPEIAQKLNVAYVVEGSVQKSGTRVKITAQLIKAADGFHVWSDTFTREMKDVFAMQDEIAGLIAKQLQLSLGGAPRVAKTVDPEAHRLLLEGRYFWNLRNDEGYTRAEAALAKALAIDPQYAEAHSALGGVCVIRELYRQNDGFNANPEDSARARAEAQRAIELDPALAEPHAVLGYAWVMQRGHLHEADEELQRALALGPNNAVVRNWHAGGLGVAGRLDEALSEQAKAAELDPLWFINLQVYAQSLAAARRPEAALEVLDRAAALRPEVFIPNNGWRARLLLALGRKEDAVTQARFVRQNPTVRPRREADTLAIGVLREAGFPQEAADFAVEVFQRMPGDSYLRGFVLTALGRFDEALPFLEQTPVIMTRYLFYDSLWDPWRNDPRWAQLMAKLGCTEEYRHARETLARLVREPAVAEPMAGRQEAKK